MNPCPPYNCESLSRNRSYNEPATIGPTIAAKPRLHPNPINTGALRPGSPSDVSTAAAVHTEENPPAYSYSRTLCSYQGTEDNNEHEYE